jgi:RNA polymerase sigma-70 factor (ECF subfamily)
MAPDDSELMLRIQSGDEEAFEAFVGRYQKRLYRLAYASLGNREEALDATQEAFVKMYQARHRYRPEGSPGTWIHRILVNACIDRSRRRRLRRTVPLDEAAGGRGWPPADPGGSPLKQQQRREARARLDRAMARLPERQRIVLVLRHSNDMSIKEISRVLDCSVGTIKSTLHRALGRLRKMLGPSEGGEE